jgi:hypothetical protein
MKARLTYTRTWRERLLSWPWRPWHNVATYEVDGVTMEGTPVIAFTFDNNNLTTTAREA